jgi:Raf kinase inhibitor-like YbhB/YbcL family protein
MEEAVAMTLTSPAFADGQPIPVRYTGDGENMSPPLAWQGGPPATKSYVLVVEDLDAPAGVFGHWGVRNLTGTGLMEGAGYGDTPNQARNGFGHLHYDGPAPPRHHGVHHYRFRLAALAVDNLDARTVSVAELWQLAQGQKLAEAELIGTYARR